jgi:hypothetical protein
VATVEVTKTAAVTKRGFLRVRAGRRHTGRCCSRQAQQRGLWSSLWVQRVAQQPQQPQQQQQQQQTWQLWPCFVCSFTVAQPAASAAAVVHPAACRNPQSAGLARLWDLLLLPLMQDSSGSGSRRNAPGRKAAGSQQQAGSRRWCVSLSHSVRQCRSASLHRTPTIAAPAAAAAAAGCAVSQGLQGQAAGCQEGRQCTC